MEIRDRKAAQRRAGIMARRGLPQAERAAANAAICARLLAMPCFQKAENLLLYAAFGGEVDLAVLAEQAARLGKTVAYPVCGENFTLTAAVPGPDGWEVGAYGIRTPVLERAVLIRPEALDLVLVPCTAFDAVCRRVGIAADTIAGVINNYILKNGRMQRFTLGAHHGTLLTSKHENSIAYDTNLRYIASTNEDCTVLIIVDAVSRKYFTSETSWLWDIDFDQLNVPHVKRVILSGMYRNDLAERFRFTGVQNWEVIPGIPDAAAAIRDSGSEALYVVTCFSDRDKLLNLPDVEKEG